MGAASDDEGLNGKEPPRKRPRKSRSRGLRARTGCLTCRSRHKKCGEEFPVCESCRIAGRECVYGSDRPSRGSSAGDRVTPPVSGLDQVTDRQSSDESNTAITQDQVDNTQQHSLSELQSPRSLNIPPPPQFSALRHDGPSPTNPAIMACIPEESTYPGCTQSPGTSHSFTADGASTRWLDLLAFDAAQADEAFSLVSSPRNEPAAKNANSISTRGLYQRLSVLADVSVTSPTSAAEYGWREHQDIVLSDQEAILFRNFAEHAALWLDLLDPERHFSTYATRLALRNIGLMKAILALASRHDALKSRTTDNFTNSASGETNAQAIQYYYETLHYVQTALHSPTYTHSEEILATAIIISTYEMLDESASGWQRHLKGVFWIQRSQDVDGESGGLRQSVWWAWLRQDIWAAFREKRKCYSFWVPTRAYANMTQHDLATRAIYNLSKAVNYSADTATNPYGDPASLDPEVLLARKRAGQELLGMLETWHMYLGPGFRPLPCPQDSVGPEKTPFTPIWIHPPNFAVAIMLYNFAKILITLHLPPEPGFSHHLKTQRALSDCVAAICGIALALRDEGCQIITARCVYGAGLCVQDPSQRNAIISLIQACEDRTGWPMSTLRNDLLSEWQKVDQT